MTTIAENLKNEIESFSQAEPRAKMFVDNTAIFWVSNDGHFVWMQNHSGLAEYIDKTHPEFEEQTPEGVGSTGTWWNNGDFENPFHVSDFLERLENINA